LVFSGIFDPTVPYCDERAFKQRNWKEFYGDVVEAILSNAPEAQGKKVHIR
jgi:hypothetical protein